jgi:septal ring factor EnvC (AmiA/AmiB activator)
MREDYMIKQSDWLKWIPIVLTVFSLAIGAVVWANSEHTDIKSWTSDQDYVTKRELEESIEKHYVTKEDFSRIEESLNNQKEDIKEIKSKLDKVIDMIHERKP